MCLQGVVIYFEYNKSACLFLFVCLIVCLFINKSFIYLVLLIFYVRMSLLAPIAMERMNKTSWTKSVF